VSGRALSPAAVLAARLDETGPLAVACSGGADSLLALWETLDWAKPHGRPVTALIVDHGLQEGSAAWAALTAQRAQALGAEAQILDWTGPKPATGLPAAARAARHRLLAEAARAAGARVIVTGHTGTDAAENAALGQGRLSEWSPSPAWPEGRGVFLLRPLLSLSRRAVRTRLEMLGAGWIDDPANIDPRHARVRVRKALGDEALAAPGERARSALAAGVEYSGGLLRLSRNALRNAPQAEARAVLSTAAVCAGGGSRLAPAGSLDRLCDRLAGEETFVATLCGSAIMADDDRVAFSRNAGDIERAGGSVLNGAVWDGRYDLCGRLPGPPAPLRGRARRLPPHERRALAVWPAAARASLPVILSQDGPPTCPILAEEEGPNWRWLVPARFAAACGLIAREGQL
jgi:tRNA(Ile)-lysidine synthase